MTSRLERLAARLRAQAGYTAVELLTVLAILGIVLGALTGAWVAGFRYQVDASNRYEAQEQARTAVDRMRKELHCATSLTFTSTASVTAALPGGCPFTTSVARNVTYSTAAAGSAYELRRAGVRMAEHLTVGSVFSYIAPSPSALGKLRVDLNVDVTPDTPQQAWHLVADIVLRNTTRA